jgi:hypothetical protein
MAAAPVMSAEMGGDETDDTAGPVARSRPESPKGGSQCPAHANGLRISITRCSCAAVTMESQAPVGTECPRTRKSPGSSTAEVAEVQPLQLEPKAKPKAKTRPQPKASAHGPQRVSVGRHLCSCTYVLLGCVSSCRCWTGGKHAPRVPAPLVGLLPPFRGRQLGWAAVHCDWILLFSCR